MGNVQMHQPLTVLLLVFLFPVLSAVFTSTGANLRVKIPEIITYVKVEAMTGNRSSAASDSLHGLVIVLKNGSKYEAKLPHNKARNKPYETELSTQSDFQPSLVCSKQDIKEVYLEARANNAWYIASIETYTREDEWYTKLTADPDFNKWVDGNEEDDYPYDAKKHLLTYNGKKK